MAIYHKHMTQRVPSDPHWKVNCSAYAGAMMVNDATLGGLFGVTGRRFRELSDEPNPSPSSPGLNIPQIIKVARDHYRVNIADRRGHPWGTLEAELQAGRRILAQVEYAELGSHRCQAGGDFGHAMVLVRDQMPGPIRASDPLCGSDRLYPEAVIREAMEVFAKKHAGSRSELFWCMTRPIPRIV